MKITSRPLLALVFGAVLSFFTSLAVPHQASAAPFSTGAASAIQLSQTPIAEKARYYGRRHYGYGRRHYGYGHRHYGYGRNYGYRRYGYRPYYYGGYRRCGIRYRTFYNGYRYVTRPVRVCRY